MRTRFVGALAGLLTLVGCRSTDGPSGVIVSAIVAPKSFRAGTSVSIMVAVTNLDDQPHRVVDMCPPFEVTTLDGTRVGLTQETCSVEATERTLLPGEQDVFQASWDGSRSTTVAELRFVPPGRYLIRGVAHVEGLPEPVKSRSVEVVVTQ